MPSRVLSILAVALFVLSASANAAPVAQYNPATGGVRFADLGGASAVRIFSEAGPLLHQNAVGAPNITSDVGGARITWGSGAGSIPLDPPSFFGGNVVPVGQAASTLNFGYFHNQREFITGALVTIPEPSGMGLVSSGIVGLAMLRRRPACPASRDGIALQLGKIRPARIASDVRIVGK